MSIDPTTGLLTWDVPATQRIGTYPITFIVTGGNTSSQIASETVDLTVVNTGPPPTITAPAVSTRHGLSITLGFSVPVDPATASDAANYILTELGERKGHKQAPPPPRVIPLGVLFDPTTDEVTLRALNRPRPHAVLTLTIVGSGDGGIAKLDGLQLAGAGVPGTNDVVTIAGKKISHAAALVKRPTAARTQRTALDRAQSPGAYRDPGHDPDRDRPAARPSLLYGRACLMITCAAITASP